MRNVTYELLPDVAGKFVTKTASLAEFALEIRGIFVRKVIPPLRVLNHALLQGYTMREANWEPFEISDAEYDELLAELAGEPPLGYRVDEPPDYIVNHDQWVEWACARY